MTCIILWTSIVIVHAITQISGQAIWSVVNGTDDYGATWSKESPIEWSALDELHVRVELDVAAISFGRRSRQQLKNNSQTLFAQLVRLDEEEDSILATSTMIVHRIENHSLHHVNLFTRPIYCDLDPDDKLCIPRIIGIQLPDIVTNTDILAMNHTILIEFDHATNCPIANTKDNIFTFIDFTVYIGDELYGTWINPKTLEIRVIEIEIEKVKPLRELMNELLKTTLIVEEMPSRVEENQIQSYIGELRYRVEREGTYVIQVLSHAYPQRERKAHILSTSPEIVIKSTNHDVIIVLDEKVGRKERSITVNEPSGIVSQQVPTVPIPSLVFHGVTSHAGNEGLVLPHRELGVLINDPGSWSFSFWLFTNEDSTGVFRTLFFNGDGTDEQRTPSAWFRPTDRKIVLRATTIKNKDVGLDSQQEIPLDEWVHLAFTFSNCSTGIEMNSTIRSDCSNHEWFYAMEFYINGELDQHVKFSLPVIPNAGPFHIAKGPWTDGFKGFVSDVRVWNEPLDYQAHNHVYQQGRKHHQSFQSKDSRSPTCTTENGLNTIFDSPSNQISFLVNCIHTLLPNVKRDYAVALKSTNVDPFASLLDTMQQQRRECKPDSWDLLLEVAELGNKQAIREAGRSLMLGRFEFVTDVKVCFPDYLLVEVDHSRARNFLIQALNNGEWDTAFDIAVLLSISTELFDSLRVLRELKLGLYHLAAAGGRKDAYAVLGRLYETGGQDSLEQIRGVIVNVDIAAFHYLFAANDASLAYHERGKQPLHEMNRLYDTTYKEDVSKGQKGDDDELIQFQKMRADNEGDVEAMASMGDLYYWGARGLERDHVLAHNYFERAAQAGHVSSQSAVAGMYLKGEGVAQDNVTAIKWYTKAAEQNHTRALNGLGFIHFYGSGGVPENRSLALEYFERAAANQEDGDSIYNTGYCHAFGLGTIANITHAMEYYDIAAQQFGHFDAIHEMGKLYHSGMDNVIARNPSRAITYLKAASAAGRWGRNVRDGFDHYLKGDYTRAKVLYHVARELGYPIATSNLAFLYDKIFLPSHDDPAARKSEEQALQYLLATSEMNHDKEVLVRIGDYYFYGLGGVDRPNAAEALKWYSRASAKGVEAGAYNVGHMYEYGLGGVGRNYDRAKRYYHRVLELASSSDSTMENYVVVHLAIIRLQLRQLLENSRLEWLLPHDDRIPNSKETSHADQQSSIRTVTSTCIAVLAVSIGAWFIQRQRS